MYYYFLSDYPTFVKIDGIPFGKIFDAVKFCSFENNATPFIEVYSLENDCTPLTFLIDKDFLFCPPENVIITDLDGGFLIKFIKRKAYFNSLVKEEIFNDVKVQIYSGTESYVAISGYFPTEKFIITPSFKDCIISQNILNGKRIIAVELKGTKNFLYLYNVNGKPEKLLETEYTSFSFGAFFLLNKKLSDMAKHEILYYYAFRNGEFTLMDKKINYSPNFSFSGLSENLIPYAFLEEYLVNGKTGELLSEELLKNEDKIPDYLGNFIGIMPPPLFKEQNLIGLIYKKTQRIFKVKYLLVTVENGKIINLKLE